MRGMCMMVAGVIWLGKREWGLPSIRQERDAAARAGVGRPAAASAGEPANRQQPLSHTHDHA